VALVIVFVGFAVFFISGLLVRSIAKRLIPGETAHADPDGFFLWLDLKRSLIGFEDYAHWTMVNNESAKHVEPQLPGYRLPRIDV
jgi:hypothetical protein